jgi:hypothetical protein
MKMTKKMYAVAFAAIFTVLAAFGAPSEAKVMKFDRFSIDVPAGWEVNEDKENSTTSFIAPEKSAALTVAICENEDGLSGEEYAKQLMQELNGRELGALEDGWYAFPFKPTGGPESKALLNCYENMVFFMTVIGENDAFDDMIGSIKE